MIASTFKAAITTTAPVVGWAASIEATLSNVLGAQMMQTYVKNSAGVVISNTTSTNSSSSRRLLTDSSLVQSRRLQLEYEIMYEAVVFPGDSVTATTVARRGQALVESGSSEMDSFVSQLTQSATPMTFSSMEIVIQPRQFQVVAPVNAQGALVKVGDLPYVPPYVEVVNQGGGVTEEVNAGALIGGIIGGLVGLFCIFACCYCWLLMRKRLRES